MQPQNREGKSRHFLLTGALAPGSVIGSAATVYDSVALDDFERGRFRTKLAAAGGTFSFFFARPDAYGNYVLTDVTQVHTVAAAADIVVADTNEDASDNIELYGEAFIIVRYVDDGDGSTIDYVAFSGFSPR